jgi:Na+-translocating ferredoxin:NAD+ oxidoreductase RnfG subunit
MDKIKNQLAGVAALLGVIAAIGGGFVKYGEVMTKLEILEAKESADYSSQIAVLEEKVEALSVQHSHTKTLINEKQIELLKVQIEEIRASSSNPLAN